MAKDNFSLEDLSVGSIITAGDVDYLVDEVALKQIKENQDFLVLIRLIDQKQETFKISELTKVFEVVDHLA